MPGLGERIKDVARRAAIIAALGVVALIFFVLTISYLVSALFLWLLMAMSPPVAALVTAVIVLIVCGILLFVAKGIGKGKKPHRSTGRASEVTHQVAGEVERQAHQVLQTVRERPYSTALAAMAVGVVLGTLGGRLRH